jgi:adenylate cyclase
LSLFNELKRRNVFRVAAAYLAIGWVLLQLSDVVVSLAGAPDWVGKAIIALLLLGFVPVVTAAWVFEVGPEGIRRDDGSSARDESPQARRLDVITLAAVVLLLLVMVWQYLSPAFLDAAPDPAAAGAAKPPVAPSGTSGLPGPSPSAEVGGRSIAVLPFANMSPDPENEYFADGVAEEVLNVLARIEGLRVASRTSAFTFRGATVDIPEIAARLGVAHILEGSVRRHGRRVRISAQLIDARSDQHLWSAVYDRELEDIFAIQEEIAQAIADALRDTLGIRQVTVRAPTDDFQAYELYLRGRQLFALRGVSLVAARKMLEQAVERDPQFAAAWAVLASIYRVTPSYVANVDSAQMRSLAASAAARALTLDADQPAALSVQSSQAADGGDYVEAARLQRRALELDPNDANAWLWLGLHQIETGHLHAARDSLERARQLDPLAGIYAGWLGYVLGMLGERSADELLREAVGSGWAGARWFQARLALMDGPGPRAATAFRLAVQEDAPLREPLQRAFAAVADGLESEPARLRALEAISGLVEAHPDVSFVMPLLELGEQHQALDEALRARERLGFFTTGNLWAPPYRPFRELPGFLELARQMGQMAYWDTFGDPDFCHRVETPDPHLKCTR